MRKDDKLQREGVITGAGERARSRGNLRARLQSRYESSLCDSSCPWALRPVAGKSGTARRGDTQQRFTRKKVCAP